MNTDENSLQTPDSVPNEKPGRLGKLRLVFNPYFDMLEQHTEKILNFKILQGKNVKYLLILIFLYVFIINAWICDDAYITFRTCDNFVNGYGLTWNVAERVQVYTNPLWMFVVAGVYFLTRELYYTSLALSLIFSFAAFYLVIFKISNNIINSIIAFALLIFSKAFIDFTTSGLENPLAYFLGILFIYVFLKSDSKQKLLQLSLIAALSAVNRADTLLLCLPAIAWLFRKNRSFRNFLVILLGFVPIIAWEIFSVIYYGFPVPNTAFAKLNTGLSDWVYVIQGLHYLEHSIKEDPITLLTILLGFVALIIMKLRKIAFSRYSAIMLGVLLYLAYTIKVGGDFMSGRFISLPFLIVVGMLSHIGFERRKAYFIPTLFLAVLIGISSLSPPVLFNLYYGCDRLPNFGESKSNPWWLNPYMDKWGVDDERAFFYPMTGLLPVVFLGSRHVWIDEGKMTRKASYKVITRGALGFFGYYAGPKIYIIDFLALSDPFLSKIPISPDPGNPSSGRWRIGHFYRRLPKDYYKTILLDSNLIEDKYLAQLYDKIKIVTRGDLFSAERWKEIWKFNTGAYNYLAHKNYEEIEYPLARAADTSSIGVYFNDWGIYYAKNNEFAAAVAAFRNALKTRQTNLPVYENLFKCYLALEKPDSANIYARRIIYKSDKIPNWLFDVYNEWIEYFQKQNQIAQAILFNEKELELDTTKADAYTNLGVMLFDKGDYDRAISLWKKAISVDKRHLDACNNLINIYLFLGDKKTARQYYEEFTRRGGVLNPEVLKLLNEYGIRN